MKKKSFSYIFLLCLFIFASLFGFIYVLTSLDINDIMFWFFLNWAMIFSLLAFYWLNIDRRNKLERVLKPIVKTFGTLVWLIVPILGIIYSIYAIFNGTNVNKHIGTLILMIILLIFDRFMMKNK